MDMQEYFVEAKFNLSVWFVIINGQNFDYKSNFLLV
jgi:hypothetical protein